MPVERVGRVVGGADELDREPGQDPASREVGGGELPVGLVPDEIGRRFLEQRLDPEVPGELEMGPVKQGIAERVGHGPGPGPELVERGRGACDQVFGDAVGPHRPPLVVVPLEPGLVEVGEPAILGDVFWRQVAVVVDDRLGGRDAVVQVAGGVAREQEISVQKRHRRLEAPEGRRNAKI